MEIKGVNGQVSFDGRTVTISREGFFGWASQGRGTKQIPLSSIGAVQLRPPSLHANGVWSISVLGEVQSSRTPRGVREVSAAGKDENSVIVKRSQVKDFQALTEAINSARTETAAPPDPAEPNQDREAIIVQLRQLGAMHHRKAIDDATFIHEAHQLLPRL